MHSATIPRAKPPETRLATTTGGVSSAPVTSSSSRAISILLLPKQSELAVSPSSAKESKSKSSPMVRFQRTDLRVNVALAEVGILAVETTSRSSKKTQTTTSNSFILGNRELVVMDKSTAPKSQSQALKKNEAILNQIRRYSQKELEMKAVNAVMATTIPSDIINTIASYLCVYNEPAAETRKNENMKCIVNLNRSEECFLPLDLDRLSKQPSYIYPWTSQGKNFTFNGVDRAVTCGCMFGTILQGWSQYEKVFPIIKHDIKFAGDERIEQIIVSENNPYEYHTFHEFEKFARFLSSCLAEGTSTDEQLLYHLPYYDYILFGVELFIRNRITLAALDTFFVTILQKKIEYTQKIQAICQQYNIRVKVQSPFENLFSSVSSRLDAALAGETPLAVATTILNALGLSTETSKATPLSQDNSSPCTDEKALVQTCLNLLKENIGDIRHQRAWQDFITLPVVPKEKHHLEKSTSTSSPNPVALSNTINNLEDLFKIANAIMIAIASRGIAHGRTLAYYPLTEKQIQVSYDSLLRNHSALPKQGYTKALFATVVDSFVSYNSAGNKGLLFYQHEDLRGHIELSTKWWKNRDELIEDLNNASATSSPSRSPRSI